MSYILGLDVSTSIIGYTILDSDFSVVEIDHIDLRKIKGLWCKTDSAKIRLNDILEKYKDKLSHVYIEESLQVFRSGFSSAHTLSTLSKFNGLIFYIVRGYTNKEPVYISAIGARKTCGIKIKKGEKAKIQAFNWVTTQINMEWPMTKKGNIQQYCYDRSDSYVIARAGYVLENIVEHESIK